MNIEEAKMQNYKIKVANEAESKEAQELLFELGYEWRNNGKEYYKILEDHFIVTFSDKVILQAFLDYYNMDYDEHQEITLPQLRDLVILQKNDLSGSTHQDQNGFQWIKLGDSYYQWNIPDGSNEPRWIKTNPEGNTLLSRAETGVAWQDAFRALSEEKEVKGFVGKTWININKLTVECIKNAKAFRLAPPTVTLEGNFTKEELLKIAGEMV